MSVARRLRRLHIAWIVPGFSASSTDWCIPALLHLARALARAHRLSIIPLRYPHHRRPYDVFDATVLPQGGGLARGLARTPLLLRAIRCLLAEHRRQPFDVLHALWAHEPGVVAALASLLLDRRILVSLMGGELVWLPRYQYGGRARLAGKLALRLSLARAARVTAGSLMLAESAAQLVAAERLALLPLGVDTVLFSPHGDRLALRGDPALLCVASLVPVKDHYTLLDAVARLVAAKPSACLHVVGDGPLRAPLVALAGQLGIGSRIDFHGAVRHEALPSFYRAADLCVLASRHESQGMVVLEAAACGRLTVGTRVGILPELPGNAAAPVAPGDAEGLAAAILTLLGERERLDRTATRLRSWVETGYTVDATCERLETLYYELAP
jgi:glycosyltransferase involved in cell wall biosynthesis